MAEYANDGTSLAVIPPQTAQNGADWGSILGAGIATAAPLYAANKTQRTSANAFGQQQTAAGQAINTLAPAAALTNYAIPKLTSTTPNLADMPGYEFGRSQGEQGINRGMAARGMYNSGAALKGLTKFNQDYANTQYGNYFNRTKSLLDSGIGATNSIAGIQTGLGNAGAASTIASGNASNSGILGAGMSLANYLGSTPKGSSKSNGSSLIGAIGSGVGNLSGYLSDYFAGDGSINGGYTGTGNTVGSLTSAGGYQGDTSNGGSGYWNNYTPTQDNGYYDEVSGQYFNG